MDEYKLWKYTIAHGTARTLSLSYSAGKQYSLGKLPRASYIRQNQFINWAYTHRYGVVPLVNLDGLVALQDQPDWLVGPWTSYEIRDFDRTGGGLGGVDTDELYYYDYSGNGYLDDAERDEDADGLNNQWEATGCMTRRYWDALYKDEAPYYLGEKDYGHVNLDDEDTDGDGIRDGADDLDHDDIPNVVECSRYLASGKIGPDAPDDATPHPGRPARGWVNPYNPCLPHYRSRTCKRYVGVGAGGKTWAPFDPEGVSLAYRIFN